MKALIHLKRWKDAQRMIQEAGVFYYDLDLVEAILRSMNALIIS